MSNPTKALCIYHANCADGFGAAWAVRAALREGVEFHAAGYGSEPPAVDGRTVYIVDFSYPRAVLIDMASRAQKIVVLDHHKTAQADLSPEGLPVNVTVHFDMQRSGARMAWDFFHPEQAPALIQHIEDRDLWRFDLSCTREIQAALFSYPYDFAVWDDLMRASTEQLAMDGAAIERKHHKDVAELVSVTQRRMVIGGHDVPVANLPYTMSSDAGHLMAAGEPFAACYWDTAENRVFSLRSTDAGLDVSEIAKQYGGGGHRNAAGFRVHRDHPLAIGTLDDNMGGAALIAAERQRQIHVKGWSREHDADNQPGILTMAAICYANMACSDTGVRGSLRGGMPTYWPWDKGFWKPGPDNSDASRIRELEKAGALIAAEIDRLLAREVAHG